MSAGGIACKIEATRLARHGRDQPQLLRLVGHYLYVELRQLTMQSVCSHFHALPNRLARCLLMSQDRLRSRDLWLKHEQLAHMLGARCAGVTRRPTSCRSRG